MAAQKSRTYAYVQKVMNLPHDWREQFEKIVMPSCYVVHDMDETNPHVHFMVDFNSPVRSATALDVMPDSFGILYAEPVRNRNSYQRYMLHIDQPEKHQYPFEDLHLLYGCKVKMDEMYNVDFVDVYEVIERENITNFAALLSRCVKDYPQLVKVISNHSFMIKAYVTDRARAVMQ